MKKRFCILLAMIMVFCLLPMSTTAASAVWDGTIATGYAGGTGTQAAPYQIASGQQLAYLAQQVNAGTNYEGVYFVLTDDIVLNDTTDWQTWGTVAPTRTWTPIGTSYSISFAGTFDGGNHTVSGIYINTTNDYAGLFGSASSASTIENLGVIDSYICSSHIFGTVGAIVGNTNGSILNCYNTGTVDAFEAGGIAGANSGTIDNCINRGSVVDTIASNRNTIGGIVGLNMHTVTWCTNLGTVGSSTSSSPFIGGIAGVSNHEVLRCYNGADVIGTTNSQNVGGIVGYYDGGIIQDCYNTGTITKGHGIAGVNNSYSMDEDISRCYNVGMLDSGYAGICGSYSGYETYCYYLDTTATTGFTGRADAAGVCESLTAAEMQVQANFAGFDFTDVWEWSQVGDEFYPYAYPILQPAPAPEPPVDPGVDIWDGTSATGFDSGTGTELDPYIIMTPEQLAYFRDQVNGGRLFTGEYVRVGADLYMNDTTNWQTWDTVAPARSWTPIGAEQTNKFAGTFDGDDHVISGIYNNSAGLYVGLFGYASATSTIKNLGVIDSYICASNASGFGGGIAAVAQEATFINCYNTGTVTGLLAGGIIANSFNCTVSNCWNTGRIDGALGAGGITSYVVGGEATFELCANWGEVTVSNQESSVGGINGLVEGDCTVARCYNGGTISALNGDAGGITGKGDPGVSIINCYNVGTVSSQLDGAGGLVGSANSSSIQNSYNVGTVTGTANKIGLIAGRASNTATYSGSYYLDDATSLAAVGEYYDWSTDPDTTTYNLDFSGTAPLTDTEMQVQANFTGYDFTNIWTMAGDPNYPYPELVGLHTLPDIWDGTSATGFDSGTGTELDPYIIVTPEQLAYFRDQVNGGRNFDGEYIRVGADLHMNDTTSWQTWSGTVAPTNAWTPIGDGTNYFSGTFDGDSHTISGIYYNSTAQSAGLFGYAYRNSLQGFGIYDLSLVESYISGGSITGGIIGNQTGGTIARCYNGATVISTTSSYTGGIAGNFDGGTLTDCYNTGSITNNYNDCYVGGIVGDSMGANISNCYNAGQINSSGSSTGVKSFGGTTSASTVTNCYYLSTGPADDKATPLTDAQMRVQANFTGFDFTNVWGWAQEGDELYPYAYPILKPAPAEPEPQPIALTVATLGGAARFDKTAIRFGASISFADMAALNVGDTVDYGFSINGLKNNALAYANWTKFSAASTTVNFAGFEWTAAMDAATTTETLTAAIRATGIKVYEYDATTITFAIILNNLPTEAQDSLWVFEPYVTINATDTSLGTAKYNSINRILEDIASGTYTA